MPSPTVIYKYTNSQDEVITIERIEKEGEFIGEHMLVIHDDPEISSTRAPMLLDKRFLLWLIDRLTELKEAEVLNIISEMPKVVE